MKNVHKISENKIAICEKLQVFITIWQRYCYFRYTALTLRNLMIYIAYTYCYEMTLFHFLKIG